MVHSLTWTQGHKRVDKGGKYQSRWLVIFFSATWGAALKSESRLNRRQEYSREETNPAPTSQIKKQKRTNYILVFLDVTNGRFYSYHRPIKNCLVPTITIVLLTSVIFQPLLLRSEGGTGVVLQSPGPGITQSFFHELPKDRNMAKKMKYRYFTLIPVRKLGWWRELYQTFFCPKYINTIFASQKRFYIYLFMPIKVSSENLLQII